MNFVDYLQPVSHSKRFVAACRSRFLKISFRPASAPRPLWLLSAIIYLSIGLAAASGAEITHLVINNSRDNLLLSIKIQDIITRKVPVSVKDEVSSTIVFSIALYQVHHFWFDKKIAYHTATNTIKHHPQKKEYRLLRSWDSGPPLAVDSLNEARLLMAEVNNLKLMPLAGLEKGRDYQIRVQAVCQDQNAFIFSPSGCFKTDWHTVDFTF